MTEREKRNLKRQLQMQGEMIAAETDTGRLTLSLVATCNSLLKSVGTESLNGLSKEEFDQLYAGYLSVASQVIKFYGSTEQNQSIGSDRTVLLKKLETETNSIVNAQKEIEFSQEKLEALLKKNTELKKRAEQKKQELSQAKQIHNSLVEMEKECTLEMIKNQKEKNSELLSHITKNRSELENLREEEKRLSKETETLNQNILELSEKIKEVPEDNHKLLTQFEKQKEVLDRLLTAKSDCSEEKQQELQKQIEELSPAVEELQSNCEILKNRMETLTQKQIEYDKEKQKMSTNILQVINESLSELSQVMKEREAALQEVKKTADTLAENVETCDKMREEYADWFEAVQTPLESMIVSLNRPEFTELKNTLNLKEIAVVKKLFEDIRHNLNELDGILEKCVAATRKDQKKLERRIRP